MALIAFPDVPSVRIEWEQPQVEQVQRSPWTGHTGIVQLGGAARWSATLTLARLKGSSALAWRAFAFALRGRLNVFRLEAVEADQHVATPTVRVNGATGAGSTALPLDGLPNSTTLLPAGSLITVTLSTGDEQLIGLTEALTSNSSGEATANLATPLRGNTPDNAIVETRRPWGLMRAVNPVAWGADPGSIYEHVLQAEEAF